MKKWVPESRNLNIFSEEKHTQYFDELNIET